MSDIKIDDVSAAIEKFFEPEEIDTDALSKYIETLPTCDKCQFAPATHLGALKGVTGLLTGMELCDKHDFMSEKDFAYAESLRRAVKLLIDLDEEPWWVHHHQVTFKQPKVAVEIK